MRSVAKWTCTPFNNSKPEAHQFAARNRIVAGVADATIVVEAGH